MPKHKGKFLHLTDQDLYWDGIDEDCTRYGIESFKRDIKREIHKERNRYRELIDDTSDDYLLQILRGEIQMHNGTENIDTDDDTLGCELCDCGCENCDYESESSVADGLGFYIDDDGHWTPKDQW